MILLDPVFGNCILFAERNHFTNVQLPPPEPLTHLKNLFKTERRSRYGLENPLTAAFHSSGDRYFAVTSQERDNRHLAQIEPHRIVRLVQRARRQIEIELVFERLLDLPIAISSQCRSRSFNEFFIRIGY